MITIGSKMASTYAVHFCISPVGLVDWVSAYHFKAGTGAANGTADSVQSSHPIQDTAAYSETQHNMARHSTSSPILSPVVMLPTSFLGFTFYQTLPVLRYHWVL